MTARDRPLLEISRVVTEHALAGTAEAEVVREVCERLVAAGVPLRRLRLGVDTLHPLVGGHVFRWARDVGVEVSEFAREGAGPTAAPWVNSPFHPLLTKGRASYRFRYPPADGRYPFPVLAELAAEGVTDYLACVQRLGDAVKMGELDCVFSSWATDAADGFADEDIALIEAVVPFVATTLLTSVVRQITRTLLSTYLGADAGDRVLRGAIDRGVAERIRAVVWLSDLEGFTRIVDEHGAARVLPLLDDCADPQVAAIHAHGGTVLKFIGDGILAIFPTGDDAAQAGRRALAAAGAALDAIDEVRARRTAAGLPATGAYLALHLGEVSYGNIGGADRLDFTVIGPAVNEVARMSAMCRPLGQDILVSQALADAVPGLHARLVPLGDHTLRGVARPQALYAVRRREPAAP